MNILFFCETRRLAKLMIFSIVKYDIECVLENRKIRKQLNTRTLLRIKINAGCRHELRPSCQTTRQEGTKRNLGKTVI